MTTSSFWYEDVGLEKRPPLTADASCDLVVIGSGIAGLSTAYEAARWGWKVLLVIDRQETIGGVMTPRTTAHLASELDDYYHCLIKAVGGTMRASTMTVRSPRSTGSKRSAKMRR